MGMKPISDKMRMDGCSSFVPDKIYRAASLGKPPCCVMGRRFLSNSSSESKVRVLWIAYPGFDR